MRLLQENSKMAPEEKLKTYRILQILGNRFNDAYCMFTVHSTIFATENLIVGIYGTIKFAGKMPTDKYINFPLMVIYHAHLHIHVLHQKCFCLRRDGEGVPELPRIFGENLQ